MPLQKVDKENRIVSGFATLDNIDTSADVVLASASAQAFANFRGNIRLMHQPIPAGKLVNFREESFYDGKTQKFYQGIYVDVYVSKGAPEVWEMVLDGTLTGFSIGGQVTDQESQFVKDAGRTIRFIKAYDLVELSLVDSPANQLCDIFSITKAADGTTSVAGMVTQVVAENVFWCKKDELAFTSTNESKDCSACHAPAENIGWFESDGGDKTEKVNAIVAGFTKTDTVEGRENNMAKTVDVTDNSEELEVEPQSEPTPLVVNGEGPEDGEALGPDTEGDRDEAIEDAVEDKEADEDEEEAAEEAAEDPAEEAAETPEEEAAEEDEESKNPNFGKMFADLSDSIQKAIEASADAQEIQLTKVNDKLAAFESVATKLDELVQKHAALEEKFTSVTSQIENVEKRFNDVEKGVGIKKSGDLGGSTGDDKLEKSNKSIWGGRFFGSVDSI
jgi:hypothetical protein